MTRAVVLFLALACASCAASGKVVMPHDAGRTREAGTRATAAHATSAVALRSSAAADSLTLTWTAPVWLANGDTARDLQTHAVLRLKGQAPAWRPGCASVPACWDSVKAQTVPDTAAWLYGVRPGAACSVRVARWPEWAAVARNGKGWSGWGKIVH